MKKYAAWLCAAGVATGCGGGADGSSGSGSGGSASSAGSCSDLTATTASPSPGFTGTVFTIVMENKSQSEILGNSQAPTINALANAGAVAAGYKDPMIHPSEPNYLWMVAGQNFGVLDDQDPSAHPIDST